MSFSLIEKNISLRSAFISNTRAERISLISNPQGKTNSQKLNRFLISADHQLKHNQFQPKNSPTLNK